MTIGQDLDRIILHTMRSTNCEYHAQLSYVESRIQRAQQAIIELERQREQLRVYLLREQEHERDQETSKPSRNDIVFTNLLRMPQIKDITIVDNIVVVTTHEIIVKYGREKYPIGEFIIKIDFPNGVLTLLNTTNKRGDYDHPHIFNGSGCYGNIGSEITRCMSHCEVGILIPLLIQYLETVNAGDWYTHVDNWSKETREEDTINE